MNSSDFGDGLGNGEEIRLDDAVSLSLSAVSVPHRLAVPVVSFDYRVTQDMQHFTHHGQSLSLPEGTGRCQMAAGVVEVLGQHQGNEGTGVGGAVTVGEAGLREFVGQHPEVDDADRRRPLPSRRTGPAAPRPARFLLRQGLLLLRQGQGAPSETGLRQHTHRRPAVGGEWRYSPLGIGTNLYLTRFYYKMNADTNTRRDRSEWFREEEGRSGRN